MNSMLMLAAPQADDMMHPSIKICSGGGDFLPFSGTIDTGCEDSWVSQEKLDVLGLDYDELDGTAATSFTTFNGSSMEAVGQITIEWRNTHSGETHELFCLVGSANVPFDVLFGSIYFSEHAFEEFEDPILILKGKPASKGEGFLLAPRRFELLLRSSKGDLRSRNLTTRQSVIGTL
jgi:hypothetical protein